jgi:hypothetical protein
MVDNFPIATGPADGGMDLRYVGAVYDRIDSIRMAAKYVERT